MIQETSSVVNNPQLYYRLDPGEPGLLRSAPASQSMLKVTAQELRNLNRLESEARMQGRTVIFSHIKYLYGIDGSFATIRAGKTTVVSLDRKPHDVELLEPKPYKEKLLEQQPIEEPASGQQLLEEQPLEEPLVEENLSNSDIHDTEEFESEEIEKEKQDLVNKKKKLEAELNELKYLNYGSDNSLYIESVKQTDQKMKREIEEIDNKIKKLELEQFRQVLEKQQNMLSTALKTTSDLIFSLISTFR